MYNATLVFSMEIKPFSVYLIVKLGTLRAPPFFSDLLDEKSESTSTEWV